MIVSHLNPSSAWLLKFLAARHPLGIASTAPLPDSGTVPKPTLMTVWGLVRRGWVREHIYGIFYITEKGLEAAKALAEREHV